MNFDFNAKLNSVPECIIELTNLKQILLDICASLTNVPLGLFNLPHLKDLSVFQTNINYLNLLTITEIDAWNSDTDFYLQLTSMCDDEIDTVYVRKSRL